MASRRSTQTLEAFPPPVATPAQGVAQRQRVQTLLENARWWTVMASVAGLVLFTVLAARDTNATQPSSATGTGGSADQATIPSNAPSQSLFQGQGVGDDGSGLLAPSSSFGAPVRSRTS